MGGKQTQGIGAQAWLAAIIEFSDEAIISKTLDGTITSWNEAAERVFGYTADEAIGRNISMLSPPGTEQEMPEILERLRQGQRVQHYETVRRRKDGALIDVSVTVSPIRTGSGRIVGASKIARDITDRKRDERRLRLLMAEVDHRTNNMLAIAQSMVRLTRARSIDDFTALLDGRLTALARIHSLVAGSEWDGAAVPALVREIVRTVPPDAAARVRMRGPPVMVSPATAQVLGLTLHELAVNAARHGALSADKGTVSITWTANRDLTLRWQEAGGPRVAEPEARGLGLQIIERQVVDQLGGEARLQWLPAGLRCHFRIPAEHLLAGPRKGSEGEGE